MGAALQEDAAGDEARGLFWAISIYSGVTGVLAQLEAAGMTVRRI